jgi:hypothetical protein
VGSRSARDVPARDASPRLETKEMSNVGHVASGTRGSRARADWRSKAARVLSEPVVLIGLLLVATCVYTWYGATQKTGYISGDEWRYLWYAENLLKGYYSPPDYVFLWGGPGYPLFLLPFVAAGASVAVMQAANGVLLGLAHLAFFLFVRHYASALTALACTVLLALYVPIFDFLPLTYSEPLSFALVCGLLYTLSRAVSGSWTHVVAAGVLSGWLVLTKVGFWPQIFGGCAISAALALWNRFVRRGESWRVYRNMALALLVGILCCVPYLSYTQRVTGRTFYWGAGTGSIVYWISNPYGNHYGEWYHPGWVEKLPELREHHHALFQRIGGYDKHLVGQALGRERIARSLAPGCSPEADDTLKQVGVENIKAHPGNYLRNVGYNALRLLFDWPSKVYEFSAARRRLAYCAALILAGVAFFVARLIRGSLFRGRLLREDAERKAIALFALWMFFSYLGMLSLVSAVGRYFVVIAPVGVGLFALAAAPFFDRWLGASRSRQQDAT